MGFADWGRLGALLLPDKGLLPEAWAEWGRCLLPLKPWLCTDADPSGCRTLSPAAAPPCMPGLGLKDAAASPGLLLAACVPGADTGLGMGCDAVPGGVGPLNPPVDRLTLEACRPAEEGRQALLLARPLSEMLTEVRRLDPSFLLLPCDLSPVSCRGMPWKLVTMHMDTREL